MTEDDATEAQCPGSSAAARPVLAIGHFQRPATPCRAAAQRERNEREYRADRRTRSGPKKPRKLEPVHSMQPEVGVRPPGRRTSSRTLRSRSPQRAPHADPLTLRFPSRVAPSETSMANESVPGTTKPVTLLARRGRLDVWLRPGGFHPGPSNRCSSKGRLHDCNRTACLKAFYSVTCKGSPYTNC